MNKTQKNFKNRAIAVIGNLSRKTPDEIAKFLEKNGIKGYLSNSTQCPVSMYIRNRLDGYNVTVQPERIEVYSPQCSDHVWVNIGNNLRSFILNFDNGVYPKLKI